ncbi:MAG: lytic transglycosylase domain-containing protein [Gammaproteobacteria bacterium]|nr:lytic transglycosylase domain-containing protein [Gammaproteobacteria bacterium]
MIGFILASMLAYDFPIHYGPEQEVNAAIIIDRAIKLKEDPHFMVALAWTESRLISNRISKTGDYGIFQINYNFWGKHWGYSSRKKFLVDMSSPDNAAVAASVVLHEMRKYKSCRGQHLAACYNGGPSWKKSKNKKKILAYARKVNAKASAYKKRYPGWLSR